MESNIIPIEQRSALQIDNAEAAKRLAIRSEFETNHHDFLIRQRTNCFISDSGWLMFMSDSRAEVRTYFGGDHWTLTGTILRKQVDGVIIGLICQTTGEEVEI